MSQVRESLAVRRLLLDDAFTTSSFDPASPAAEVPRIVDTPVTSVCDVQMGMWHIEVGAVNDVEVDEVFLVLAGTGHVAFSDGSILQLRPGVLVRLVDGDQTTWVIDQPLRKLSVAWPHPTRQSRPLGDNG